MKSRHQVVIVGGGPVGVALAVELGQRGISCALVERRRTPQRVPKGQGLTTLEYAVLRSHDAFLNHIQSIEREPESDVEGVTQAKLGTTPPPGEEAKAVAVIGMSHGRDGSDLRHALDEDDSGYDRIAREMAGLVPLVSGEGVLADRANARLELDDAIDQQERVAVWDERFDRGFVEGWHREGV